MHTTFIYLNKCVININILKLKKVDFSESENNFSVGTEGVHPKYLFLDLMSLVLTWLSHSSSDIYYSLYILSIYFFISLTQVFFFIYVRAAHAWPLVLK